jgi:signal transduction histidine kinase
LVSILFVNWQLMAFLIMRTFYLFIIVLLIYSEAIAQPEKRDSLQKLILVAKEDSAKVNLYILLGECFEYNIPDSAKYYYRKAIVLGTQLKYLYGMMRGNGYYANVCTVKSENDSALIYINRSLDLSRQMKDSVNIGVGLFNLGSAYRNLSDLESAVKYSLEGANILEGIGKIEIAAQLNNGLQVLYTTMGQYAKAIDFGEKAVRQSRELNNDGFLVVALSNLSLSYMEIDSLQEKAKNVLNETIRISAKIENVGVQSAAYLNLAAIAINEERFELASKYAEKAMEANQQIGSPETHSKALRALAIYYLQKKDFVKARSYSDSSYHLAEATAEQAACLQIKTIIAFASGNLIEGQRYYRASEKLINRLFNETIIEKEAGLRIRYETEKKELQISSLESDKKVQQLTISRKNTLNYLLIGGAVALLLILILTYRTYSQKQTLQQQRIYELETEKKLEATEAVLKGEEQERTRLAKDLHDGLGGMLSGIKHSLNTMKGNLIMTPDNAQAFERSMDMLDSSIKEMRRVAHNMMPEALVKFGLDTALRDFCNDINQSGALKINYQSIGLEGAELDQTVSITIYRIIQELINNTIKHAAASSAIVQLTKNDDQLSVTVEDNGKGFDTAILTAAKGIGWSNVQNRVEFLKGKLDVNSSPGNGTSILIEFGI